MISQSLSLGRQLGVLLPLDSGWGQWIRRPEWGDFIVAQANGLGVRCEVLAP